MHIVDCNEERHAEAILQIFNHAIVHTTALYDYVPRPRSAMTAWFADKQAHDHPVIGVENANAELLGFASYGAFRTRPANKYTMEHSVYVAAAHRGKGLGRELLQLIVAAAEQRGVHTLVGGIDLENHASIALHETSGFQRAGVIRQAAFKFGRWLDLAFYQRLLSGPQHPVDG
jgi:L-amino acid N-acyltransferase YncA